MIMTDAILAAFQDFEARAGVTFRDRELLKTAFTHRSYVNESRAAGAHNERLEFLGDAVLEIVVTDHLFRAYPDAPEGSLTVYRSALVNAATLSTVAQTLGMNECLLLSKGESKDTGRARLSILANTIEAVIGALYLDQGYEAAATFIRRHLIPYIGDIVKTGSWKDPKSAYQEIAQARFGLTPRYELMSAEGPDHNKHFVVGVFIGEKKVGEGDGKSKQEAEVKAAERALKNAGH